MGIYKCGFDDGLPAEEDWKNNISCQMVGCKNCKHFNGTVYFEANIKKGIAMWARKELKDMEALKDGSTTD